MNTGNSTDRLQWFREARFGMFVHWGLYSLLGRGEWVMHNEGIPADEYTGLAGEWQPKAGCTGEWAALAKEAGMGYAVLTTKHHDGFCLFDTRHTDFNSVRATPHARDLVGEYVEACRSHGLRVGLYYSIGDWSSPLHAAVTSGDASQVDALREFVHGQAEELLTNYGRIDVLWYDGAFYDGQRFTAESMRAQELNDMARSLQPGILINPRAGVPGHFDTAENVFEPSEPGRDWELCTCINDLWGYGRHDHSYKTRNQLLFLLANCACHGGNLLLNIGPHPDGSIPAPQRERLEEIGRWMARNGESIRGAERLPRPMSASGRVTRKDGRLYYHVFYWPGREMIVSDLDDQTLGAEVGRASVRARILGSESPLTTRWQGRRLFVGGLPDDPPDPADTVIVLETDEGVAR